MNKEVLELFESHDGLGSLQDFKESLFNDCQIVRIVADEYGYPKVVITDGDEGVAVIEWSPEYSDRNVEFKLVGCGWINIDLDFFDRIKPHIAWMIDVAKHHDVNQDSEIH